MNEIIGGGAVDAIAVLAVLACVLMLDAHDISLPRGDSVSLAGPVVAACVLISGPAIGTFVGFLGLAVSWALARKATGVYWATAGMLTRLTAVFASAVAFVAWRRIAPAGHGVEVLVPFVYLLTQLAGQQFALAFESKRSYLGLLRGSLVRQGPILAAELSAAALIVSTYEVMGYWSLIPVVALLLLIRQSWSLLLRIRDTYRTTMTVLVDAAVAQNPGAEGHAERTAAIARTIASRLRVGPQNLEKLSYASLLHDIDVIHDSMSDAFDEPHKHRAAEVVRNVAFLHDVLPILEVTDGNTDPQAGDVTRLLGFIVILASSVDAAAHPGARRPDDPSIVAATSSALPCKLKARAAAAALDLGYQLPAIT